MIMSGANIQSAADQLKKTPEEYLYNSLRNPKPQIEAKIRQLRAVYGIDSKVYGSLKRSLPYVVCGIFNPPYRRRENFAYIENFIIDIDHIATKELSLPDIRKTLEADSRVLMCFTSPSEDGLKVMFRLSERCYDYNLFSVFYREFLRRFSEQYHLEQVADRSTSDVTRACFVSVDPNAYYNLLCDPIDLGGYVDVQNTTASLDLKHELDAESAKQEKEQQTNEEKPKDPDEDVMARIKQRLNPKAKTMAEKPAAYVPQQLIEIMPDLKRYIEETGLVVSETLGIQYGQKVRIKMGLKEAEINIFHGKRGFSVVKSPRCGTNPELNDISSELIENFFLTM